MSKDTEGKYKPSLMYTSLIKNISNVRMYGIEKYGNSEDWVSTTSIDHLDAAIRHIRKHIEGFPFDSESNLPSLAHAVTNLMFEIERINRNCTSKKPIRTIDRKIKCIDGKIERIDT